MTAGRFERLVVNGGIFISDQKPNRESRAQRIPLNMVPLTFYPFLCFKAQNHAGEMKEEMLSM